MTVTVLWAVAGGLVWSECMGKIRCSNYRSLATFYGSKLLLKRICPGTVTLAGGSIS